MSVRLIDSCTVELLQATATDEMVLRAMLVSTGADKSPVEEGAKGRIAFLMKNRHGSPFEHNSFTFRVSCPIAVAREWQRHRIGWSYNEQSGRYMELEPEFYVPPADRPLIQVGKAGAYTFEPASEGKQRTALALLESSYELAWGHYQSLLRYGIAKEVARGVLPVFTMTNMYATCNARSLMHFLSLRRRKEMTGEALFPSFPMWEIDDCAQQVEDYFEELMPMTWEAFTEFGRVAP